VYTNQFGLGVGISLLNEPFYLGVLTVDSSEYGGNSPKTPGTNYFTLPAEIPLNNLGFSPPEKVDHYISFSSKARARIINLVRPGEICL